MNTLFSIGIGRIRLSEHWRLAKDGDDGVREFFDRHYSRRGDSESKQFVGPGNKMVMITEDGNALFIWRKFIDDCIDCRTGEKQVGVNCAVFRNEGPTLSSQLILDAERVAWGDWVLWPVSRLYTYVDSSKVRSTNPGACFIAAGWRRCGITKKRKLVILEKLPGARVTAKEGKR